MLLSVKEEIKKLIDKTIYLYRLSDSEYNHVSHEQAERTHKKADRLKTKLFKLIDES